MRELWIEVKRRITTTGALLAAAGATLALAAWYFLSRKNRAPVVDRLDGVIARLDDRTAGANARAAIEIHVARSKEAAVVEELKAIEADADGERRRQALVELAAKVEGRK